MSITKMKAFEKPIVKLNVKTIRALHDNDSTDEGVSQKWLYNLIEAHSIGDCDSKYVIVDRNGLIKKRGPQELSIKELSEDELKHLKSIPITSSWYNPSIRVYGTQYPIDIKTYFELKDWSKTLEIWITEGLNKDPRLVDCVKSIAIPLYGEPTLIQPLNAHSIWLNNTSTGKSYFSYLFGSEPITRAGAAGAMGSYSESRGGPIIQKGLLNGYGFPVFFDEVNTIDKPFIPELLSYLETGKATRGLKVPVTIEGTKTVVLISNPPDNDDITSSLAGFIKVVCSADHPERIGKRFGFLLVGDDYNVVYDGTYNMSLRDEVRQVIETTIEQYKLKIQGIIRDNMDWIRREEPDVKKEILDYAETIPNKLVSKFVQGQSISSPMKLKASTIRYILLEQLNEVPKGKVDLKDRDDIFHSLKEINFDSYRKISYFFEAKGSDKPQFARDLKAKYPTLSLRDIGDIVDASHTSVKNWLDDA